MSREGRGFKPSAHYGLSTAHPIVSLALRVSVDKIYDSTKKKKKKERKKKRNLAKQLVPQWLLVKYLLLVERTAGK